jgi:hypothetical protein
MKSVLIILPYFGKLPNYFQLFLNSCSINPQIHWELITDQDLSRENFTIPSNVFVEIESFGSVKKRTKKIFGSEIIDAYSLCKYRAGYPELFSKRVIHYDFWGFCDCDLIFGNLSTWITADVLDKYDKISWRGHLTLIKNTPIINLIYKKEIPGYKTFQGCINGTDGLNLFDEVGLNRIFEHEGLRIYFDLPICDLRIRDNNFICQHNIFEEDSNKNQIFEWNRKGLWRTYVRNGILESQPIAYVHFLKRSMFVGENLAPSANKYLIVPNKFIPFKDPTVSDVLFYARKKFYWSYYKKRLTFRFLLNKFVEMFNTQKKEVDFYERKGK